MSGPTPNTNTTENMPTSAETANITNQYLRNTDKMYTNMYIIEDEVSTVNANHKFLVNDAKYDFSGNTFAYADKNLSTLDVIKNDTNDLLIQANTIYISSCIAVGVLLVSAVFIGSRKE